MGREKTDSPKHSFGRPFLRTTPSPLLWHGAPPNGHGPEFSKGGFVVQLLWEGGGVKRELMFSEEGASELWFLQGGLPSSQAGVGSPLLELSKGCSGGIWWFSFLMSVESFLVVWSFFWGWCRNLGSGLEGHISVHACQVIEFWPAQILLELVSSKSILKGSHIKALEQHLAPKNDPEIWPS